MAVRTRAVVEPLRLPANDLGRAGGRADFLILGQQRSGSTRDGRSGELLPAAPIPPNKCAKEIFFSFHIELKKDGVAASKNWKARGSPRPRSGTSIYRKKIDTQKV